MSPRPARPSPLAAHATPRHPRALASRQRRPLPGGCRRRGPRANRPKDGSLPVTIYRPEGAGPFPFVVLLHGCGGLSARSDVDALGRAVGDPLRRAWGRSGRSSTASHRGASTRSAPDAAAVGGPPRGRRLQRARVAPGAALRRREAHRRHGHVEWRADRARRVAHHAGSTPLHSSRASRSIPAARATSPATSTRLSSCSSATRTR